MKTKFILYGVISALAIMPHLTFAQWNMVRFDQYNYFNKVFTVTPQTAFVGGMNTTGPGSFILRTNDGGANWDSITFNPSLSSTWVYDIRFADSDHGFAGGLNNNLQQLLSTSDNGTTWNDITPDPVSSQQINSISLLNTSSGFACSESNLYFTANGGMSWNTAPIQFLANKISFLNNTTGYACGSDNNQAVVLKTIDAGQTWTPLLTATNPLTFTSVMDKLDVINGDVVFTSLQYSNLLYRTLDNGLTWDTITVSAIQSIMDFDFISPTEGHVLSAMGEIYGTNDGGTTWNFEYAVAGGLYGPSVFLYSISFANTTGFVCGTNGLIKKYTVGTTGIQESDDHSSIAIFPNPIHGSETLTLRGLTGGEKVKLINHLGQVVVEKTIAAEVTNNLVPINLSVAPGVYELVVNNRSGSYSKKLVVLE